MFMGRNDDDDAVDDVDCVTSIETRFQMAGVEQLPFWVPFRVGDNRASSRQIMEWVIHHHRPMIAATNSA